MEISKRKRIKFTLAMSVLTFVVCLGMAEIGIRIYHYTSDRGRFVWLPDQFLAYVHSGNNTFKHHYTENRRITVEHRTNRFGFLGGDIKVKKDHDTFRVLVLGDSFTEAIQVPESKNFCGRLQGLLSESPVKKYEKIEVINTGVSGYSPLNYYLNFKREYARFRPDLVLVQLFANDVFEDNTARAKSLLDENGLPLKTGRYFSEKYFNHPPAKRNEFNDNPASYRLLKFLTDKSRFLEYMYVKIYNAQKASTFHQNTIREDQFGTGYQFFILDPEHVLSRDEVFRQRAWGYTQDYLLALKREVESRQSQFVLFYIPMEVQLALDQYGEHARLYVQKHMGTSFNGLLANFSDGNGIQFMDLLSDLEQNKSKGLYLSRDGHLTEAGHGVVADSLYRYITENNLLDKHVVLDRE